MTSPFEALAAVNKAKLELREEVERLTRAVLNDADRPGIAFQLLRVACNTPRGFTSHAHELRGFDHRSIAAVMRRIERGEFATKEELLAEIANRHLTASSMPREERERPV